MSLLAHGGTPGLIAEISIGLLVLALGAWAFWIAMSRDSPRLLTRREKLSDAVTAIVGITPRTRRRG